MIKKHLNSTYYFLVLVDMETSHKCNKRNNRHFLALKSVCNFHTHKSIDKHLLALFPFFYGYNEGK